MTIHKEGYSTIAIAFVILTLANVAVYFFSDHSAYALQIGLTISLIPFLMIVNFFRSPRREAVINDKAIIAPADGTIVAIEEVDEPEFLKTKCLQVSIFMSPLNVHINWFPVKGTVKYSRHHSGRFQGAYLPKSSTENERTTVVVEQPDGTQVLMRQVAGAMARRIVCYAKEETAIKQGEELGFIKFGSRVDLYLPLNTKIDVKLDDKTTGRQTIIGWLK
jgi:phosphatidylserine decarboxylase